MERTLILIKPDGVERQLVGEIISFYERKNLHITALKMINADKNTAMLHYKEHEGRPYFESLINYLIEGPIVALVVEGNNAVEMVRKINGDKNPLVSELSSIRGRYSNDKTRNLVHASDSVESAEREISIWFKD